MAIPVTADTAFDLLKLRVTSQMLDVGKDEACALLGIHAGACIHGYR